MNQVSLIFRFRTLFGSYPMSVVFILSYWKLPFGRIFSFHPIFRLHRPLGHAQILPAVGQIEEGLRHRDEDADDQVRHRVLGVAGAVQVIVAHVVEDHCRDADDHGQQAGDQTHQRKGKILLFCSSRKGLQCAEDTAGDAHHKGQQVQHQQELPPGLDLSQHQMLVLVGQGAQDPVRADGDPSQPGIADVNLRQCRQTTWL